ncbi:sugar ABC transporter ATP-binding protein [Nocardioides sp. QY071]|uniref:sugar ABC transporter ATP-binding protein n=1 Tax=Nocardioides sp. QY071 TaxID=3044187 RepID=UPI00249B65BC|nr:sugar ABC transporter ATP-binding protein [Nocardioides sp. QY071]WGY00466.1 sugar ABC transporter ATP-binding protein [Nocardioides sp. QY071]
MLLQVADARVTFGSTTALAGVDVTLMPGRVHALLGGNGSGKSTLIKVLAGVVRADAGSVERHGSRKDLSHWTADDAAGLGVRFVHQDLGLFDAHTVAENFAGSSWPVKGPQIRWRLLHRRARRALDALEVDVATTALVGSLSPAERALVAIARAFAEIEGQDQAGVLVLDEPSATLPDHEMRTLVERVRRIASQGHAVVYVSHRLEEIRSVADDVTVLRDGEVVGRRSGTASAEDLLQLIAGSESGHFGASERAGTGDGTAARSGALTNVRLAVAGLQCERVDGIDLGVAGGEIVGLVGLEGSGASDVLRALYGLTPHRGTVTLDGRSLKLGSPASAVAAGFGFVPADRLREGVLTGLGTHENVSIGSLGQFWRAGRFAARRYRRDAERILDEHGVRRPNGNTAITALSGGNQQKVVAARWLRRAPSVLLLEDPTQGVDVNAKRELWTLIRRLADQGSCVVVHSTDYEELVEVADRVVVISSGRVVDVVERSRLDRPTITALTYQSTSKEESAHDHHR